jgi:integrase
VKKSLSQAVDFYLETRRKFGFALVQVGVELRGLVRYAKQVGHRGPLTASLALQWAQQPQRCAPSYWALRLDIVRRFAEFWLPYDPRTEIPPGGCFGPLYRRRAVHIYSAEEVGALRGASAELGRLHPLRGATFSTLVGLLACTGLRVGEALGLSDEDIDWSAEVLTIRHAKGGHTRLVPIQTSTVEALSSYRALRRKAIGSTAGPRLFVTFRGRPLGYFGVNMAFAQLRRSLGWTHRPVPRLHDLRHHSECRIIPSAA